MALNKIPKAMLDTDVQEEFTKISNLSKAPNEYEWTTTSGQLVYTLPVNTSYDPNSKWLEVTVGGAPVSPSLIQKNSSTQFTLLVNTSDIPAGVKVVARWVEPYIPATAGHKGVHEIGGYDEIDITKLKNYQEQVVSPLADIAINVKTEGAKGDGVTDDTVSIQNAINKVLTNGGGILYFPKGTYYVTSSLLIKHTGKINLIIRGAKKTKLTKPSGVFPIFDIGSSTVPTTTYAQRIQDVIIESIDFESPDSTGTAIKVRNFGRLYMEKIYAYRFNTGYDIAGGSEAQLKNVDWAGGNLGLSLNADDGLGGTGAGVDMQVFHVSDSQFANGLKLVQITNGYDVHFTNVMFATITDQSGIVIDGNSNGVYFTECHHEWMNKPAIELNGFLNVTMEKAEFAQTASSLVSPIKVNNNRTSIANLTVEKSYYDIVSIIPLVEIKETSTLVRLEMDQNYPASTDVSVAYEKTNNIKKSSDFNRGFSYNSFNKDFTKGLAGLNRNSTTVTLSLDTTDKVTGINSVKMNATAGYWNFTQFKKYGSEPMPGESVLIDFIIKGTSFTGGVLRAVLVDLDTLAESVAVVQDTSIMTKVEQYPNGFTRYATVYVVPSNKKLTMLRFDNSQNTSANLFIDYFDVRTKQAPRSQLPLESAMPTSGTFEIADVCINTAPTAATPTERWLRVTSGSAHVLGTDWIAK